MFIEKIDRDLLLKPLQTVVGIVERKQPLPILSNVLIEKNTSDIRFSATDMEIQISSKQTIEHNDTNQAITVSAKKLQEILRVLPDGSKVSLDLLENKLVVKANKSKFSLQTLPAQDYPVVLNQLDNATQITIKQRIISFI